MKNKNLVKNLLIGLSVLFGTGIVLFMLSSDDSVVKNIKTKVFKKETNLTTQEYEKLLDDVIKKYPVKDTNITKDDVDYDDKFFGCENRVKVNGGNDICAEGENQLRYDIELISSEDTQVARKEALKEIAYDLLVKMVGTEGDPSAPYIDDLAGKNTCNILIIGSTFKGNHQDDLIKILFCDDNGEHTGLLTLDSGGIDEEGVEHLRLLGHEPLYGSFFDDSFQFSLEEMKKSAVLAKYDFPTKTYEQAAKELKSKFNNITIDSNTEELVTSALDPYLSGTGVVYAIPVTKDDGTKDTMYVSAFLDIIFTQKELDLSKKYQLASQNIIMNLSNEQMHKFMTSRNKNAMEDYIATVLPPSKKMLELKRAYAEFRK